MEDINTLYYNSFGIAFQWKRTAARDYRKIQLVFKDIGLFLTSEELVQFAKQINTVFRHPPLCDDCRKGSKCNSYLVSTPATQVSLALSHAELREAKDLIEGTLFQLELSHLLKDIL
ncbi:hypothetical protein [Ulvibacter litoralis]|uniref:Uncharacterized protein n=1 Tax=Ulvibacter litoralis TaxID=227084 RepID=A0A1G7D0Z5_9FLAO|nr:hypothetical protein [Ulvibacter litoralis]GHC45292.1 hypothetical protein GCM10008083_05040 [Ulvibacter litoralis]SDE45272.1 hypothetical protein SAMN05421855_101697 [Ulvibacter litoralis]